MTYKNVFIGVTVNAIHFDQNLTNTDSQCHI